MIWICYSLLVVLAVVNIVSARFCEGGNHKCLPPKECCAQGCCYLYSPPSAPRTTQPADHVLNLFFINHWYFWLFIFAIVLALLLLCSLWKKRHSLFCAAWSTQSNHRVPSEGDSTGSCYAPPHYSRCSSFYHAPPPYQEVTSKPDLYPLVFSYANDGSKNGNNSANYLMVQYFRNYIVRPIGSLSATSTVDSLSSSFICTANEANTLIPPPYSTAASPDGLSVSLQNYAMPRSASQQSCSNNASKYPIVDSQFLTEGSTFNNHHRPMSVPNTNHSSNMTNMLQFRVSESANFLDLFQQEGKTPVLVHQTSNSSNTTVTTTHTASSLSKNQIIVSDDDDDEFQQASSGPDMSLENGASGINFDSNQTSSIYHSNDTMLSLSVAMMEKISYSKQTNDHTKLNMIQKQLEKCCAMIQQQQQQIQQTRSQFNSFEGVSSNSGSIKHKIGEEGMLGLDYLNYNNDSTVSSLANLNSLSSPPRATSPTQEVKDLLEQINQLKDTEISDDESSKLASEPQAGPSTEVNSTKHVSLRRPTTLYNKRRFFNLKNRSVYLPMVEDNSFGYVESGLKIRSPCSNPASVFMTKSRCMKNRARWISKSAPTTPGTGLPLNFTGDNSPLLDEHEEE